jgi:hypothetical protein
MVEGKREIRDKIVAIFTHFKAKKKRFPSHQSIHLELSTINQNTVIFCHVDLVQQCDREDQSKS